MASSNIVVTVCNRCSFGTEKPATEAREFSIEQSYYRLELCDAHAQMFDREFGGWSRLATEVDAPPERPRSLFFNAEEKAKTARLRELKERAQHKIATDARAAQRAAEIEAAERAHNDHLLRLENEQAQRLAAAQQERERLAAVAAALPIAELTLTERRHAAERAAWDIVPNAPGWRLTQHARERMWEREFTPVEVLQAATDPELRLPADAWRPGAENLAIHQRGICRVVVDPAKKTVVTVIDRDAQSAPYHNPSERKAQ